MKISNIINKLSNNDKEKLQNALQQAYPADDASCDLRVGWSYDTENKKVYLEINYLVNKIKKNNYEADIETILKTVLKHSTNENIENFEKSLNIFILNSSDNYEIIDSDVINLKELGFAIHTNIIANMTDSFENKISTINNIS